MGSFSNWAETNTMQYYFSTSAPTRPAAIYVALLTSAPDDTSTGTFSTSPGTEVTNANGYARVACSPLDANWTHASGGVSNTAAITFPACTTATWGSVTHFALVTSGTHDAGNVIGWGALTTAKTIDVSDVAIFAAGALTVTLD